VTRIYVSGPMTGMPAFNFPAFHAAAAALRSEGYAVVNPAELDAADPAPMAWADYLRRDIAQLVTCEGIALLPGWEGSKGARLESHIALMLGMEVIYLKTPAPSEVAEQAQAERE
jgi:hypothetical protein